MATLLTLPPHLLETIRELVESDVKLPADLKDELGRAIDPSMVDVEVDEAEGSGMASGSEHEKLSNLGVGDVVDSGEGEAGAGQEVSLAVVAPKPPTIEHELVERLSRWASTKEGEKLLRRRRLDPLRYTTVSLLAGTEVYIPAYELERLRAAENPEKPNPFLPSYLSSKPPSIGSEFRSLTKTLSTTFNILFSIFGSSAAVYVASTTGAGYSRETAVLLAVLTGVVVGLADGILLWIFTRRVDEYRAERHAVGVKAMTGSGKLVEPDVEGKEKGMGGEADDEAGIDEDHLIDTQTQTIGEGKGTTATEARSTQIRLRRKGLEANDGVHEGASSARRDV